MMDFMIEPQIPIHSKAPSGRKSFNRSALGCLGALVLIPTTVAIVQPDRGRAVGRWMAGMEDPVITLKSTVASINKGFNTLFEELRANCKSYREQIQTLLNVKLPSDIADHEDRFCKKISLEEAYPFADHGQELDEILTNTAEARKYKSLPANVKTNSIEMLNLNSIVQVIATISELSDRQIETLKTHARGHLAKNMPIKVDIGMEVKNILDTVKNNDELKRRLINILKTEGTVLKFNDPDFANRLEVPAYKARFLSEMLGLINAKNNGVN